MIVLGKEIGIMKDKILSMVFALFIFIAAFPINITAANESNITIKEIASGLEYDDCFSFSEGLAIVATGSVWNIKWGVVDKTGKVIIPCEYDGINGDFSEGFVRAGIGNVKWDFIDKTGRIISEEEAIAYAKAANSFAITSKMGQYGIIDAEGNISLPLEYDSILNFYGNLAVAWKNGKLSILELEIVTPIGTPLGDVLYSDITAYINGEAILTSVINGKTLVVAEDLAKYVFDVFWNNSDRTLKIELNENKKINPLFVEKLPQEKKSGDFKCKYVYTDIKTYLSGEEIESYAINGVTLIDFELLARYGEIMWNEQARELKFVEK